MIDIDHWVPAPAPRLLLRGFYKHACSTYGQGLSQPLKDSVITNLHNNIIEDSVDLGVAK